MHSTMRYLWIAQWIVHVLGFSDNSNMGEPACYSRFDYDHKLMTSLVNLETKIGQLENTIKQQQETIATLTTQITEGLAFAEEEKRTLSDKILTIESVITVAGSSASYIRWGRTSCPGNGTELVYEGYVGGSDHTDSGAAANYVCLPKDPIWSYFKDDVGDGLLIYGSEYELAGGRDQEIFGTNLHNQDAPCAVCKTKRASVLMIPARNKCYDGWTLEYHGYLFGGHRSHPGASELVCLDSQPEIIPGGAANKNGKLLYPAESMCGSLNCPPYVDGRELTCAVCSL